jgi:LacI family transcriptional regulator
VLPCAVLLRLRQLTMPKRRVILLLDTTNPHQRKVAQGVATYSHQQGAWSFHVVQDPHEGVPYLKCDPLEESQDLGKLRADGIILYCPSRKTANAVRRLKTPMVGVELEYGWSDPGWGVPYFATDNEAIGRLGARELIERGFKRLAFCGIPRTRLSGWSEARQTAFVRSAHEAGVPCSVFPVGSLRGRKAGNPHERLSAWLRSLKKPVGLMACYDVRARHVLDTCEELGLLVPEDVAIIGVDNDELMCELTNPPLSSIEQGARTMGYQAAALLDRLMSGRKVAQSKFVVAPEGIVTRRSSDALAIDDADVAAAVRFIRQRACEGIQARDVVQTVAISRTALMTRFKALLGRTIHAEIQRVQIEQVRQLTAATDLPLSRVAAMTGFRYLQQMIAAFRRYTGQTPGEYRIRCRQGIGP